VGPSGSRTSTSDKSNVGLSVSTAVLLPLHAIHLSPDEGASLPDQLSIGVEAAVVDAPIITPTHPEALQVAVRAAVADVCGVVQPALPTPSPAAIPSIPSATATPLPLPILPASSVSVSNIAAPIPPIPTFPLRVVSERVRGIAFQLWPAAKVMSQFVLDRQTDPTVVTPIEPRMMREMTSRRADGEAASSVAVAPLVDATADAQVAPLPATATPPSLHAPTLLSIRPSPIPPAPSTSSFSPPPLFWPGKSVLELGAGCGLVGMLACTLGAHVTLTDMASVVDHMQMNIEANFGRLDGKDLPVPQSIGDDTPLPSLIQPFLPMLRRRIRAAALEWGKDPLPEDIAKEKYDVILLSDCVYWEELFVPLVSTLRLLSTPSTDVFLCQTPRRPKVEKRLFKMASKYFHIHLIRQVAAVEQCGEKKDVKLYALKLLEKKVSMSSVAKPKSKSAASTSAAAE